MKKLIALCAVAAMILGTTNMVFAAIDATSTFTPLGFLSGGDYSSASGVSADGSVVVGKAKSTLAGTGYEGFRWSSAGLLVGLGADSVTSTSWGGVGGASSDGSVIAGSAGASFGAQRPYRWTQAGGVVYLDTSAYLTGYTFATDVSADGSVVVGWGDKAFRWENGSWTDYGSLYPMAVSADGSVVVGEGGNQAWRWAVGASKEELGYLDANYATSAAAGVSADGSVVVGYSYRDAIGQKIEAFRWTATGGMEGLGHLTSLPGTTPYSRAGDASADGSFIVGYSRNWNSALGDHAFLWDAVNGMRDLNELLTVPSGWTLKYATGISDDGLTIVGYGTNPEGKTEAWVAQSLGTAAIPEPASMIIWGLLGAGTAGGAMWRRRRRTPTGAPWSEENRQPICQIVDRGRLNR